MSSIIFTHGDSDGICAGAIVKSALPGSSVFFTSPVGLLGELNSLTENYENIVICDIAVDEKSCRQLKDRLNGLSEVSKVTYMDHHPLPKAGFKAPWFYHDECSSSEQAYRIFEKKLNRDVRSVAIYAASYGNALVGVSCEHRAHKHVYDISIRLRNGGVDLNTILRRVAPEHGGTGGGHPFAGGARIPDKNLKAFLIDLDDALG